MISRPSGLTMTAGLLNQCRPGPRLIRFVRGPDALVFSPATRALRKYPREIFGPAARNLVVLRRGEGILMGLAGGRRPHALLIFFAAWFVLGWVPAVSFCVED